MYIPQSNIVEKGYTQGSEFVVTITQHSYKGYYFKDKSGKYWSGQGSTDATQLDPLFNTGSFDQSQTAVNSPFTKIYKKPVNTASYTNDFILPTQDDYNNGYFIRYIVQFTASTSPTFIEVNKAHYDEISTNKNTNAFYRAVPLFWKLTGPVDDQFEGNIRIASGVRNTNLRSIQESEKTLNGISNFITDPLQYAQTQ